MEGVNSSRQSTSMKAKTMSNPERSKDSNYDLSLQSVPAAHSFWWRLRKQIE